MTTIFDGPLCPLIGIVASINLSICYVAKLLNCFMILLICLLDRFMIDSEWVDDMTKGGKSQGWLLKTFYRGYF
ncbi:MAG: hypothetical protein ACK506_16645 [Pirellula sp.]|jgi:hypothetical protein